jgi:antitoxin HicB
MNVLYPAIIEYSAKERRYTVHFPDLPEAITEGETEEETLFNASEALTLTLEGRIEENMQIPLPSSTKKNVVLIAPSARAQAALLMRWARGSRKTSELARILKTSWPAANRLEDPKHWPSLRQLEKVAASLGQRLLISLEPLASDKKKKSETRST